MRVVPAVDIRGGKCVNLVQGDYDQETVFSDDPVAQAVAWRDQGAELVHIVDLDGAKAGHCCIVDELAAMRDGGVPVEVGGGIRSLDTVRQVFDLGAKRVILGTAAVENPAFLKKAAEEFPGTIVAGVDAKDGKVAVRGWVDVTETYAVVFAGHAEQAGAARIIYTDISSDGMMGGPNVAMTNAVARAVHIPITASGGVSSLDDIRALRALEVIGVDEVIVGRALYLGAFTLQDAIAAAGETDGSAV